MPKHPDFPPPSSPPQACAFVRPLVVGPWKKSFVASMCRMWWPAFEAPFREVEKALARAEALRDEGVFSLEASQVTERVGSLEEAIVRRTCIGASPAPCSARTSRSCLSLVPKKRSAKCVKFRTGDLLLVDDVDWADEGAPRPRGGEDGRRSLMCFASGGSTRGPAPPPVSPRADLCTAPLRARGAGAELLSRASVGIDRGLAARVQERERSAPLRATNFIPALIELHRPPPAGGTKVATVLVCVLPFSVACGESAPAHEICIPSAAARPEDACCMSSALRNSPSSFRCTVSAVLVAALKCASPSHWFIGEVADPFRVSGRPRMDVDML